MPEDAALFALLLACAVPPTSLDAVPVVHAELRGANFDAGTLIGGLVTGDAILVVLDNAGQEWTERVALRGPVVSIGTEGTFDPELGGPIPLELPEDALLTGAQLLGTYRGAAESLVVGAGVSARQLRNQHGVRMREVHLAFGVGAMVGFQWLRIVPGGREGLEPLDVVDSGLFVPDTGGLDTGGFDTGGTTSLGCGCSGWDTRPDSGRDTGWDSVADSPTESGTDSAGDSSADSPDDTAGDTAGDTGASSSPSCGTGPGVARGLPLWAAFALAALRRRPITAPR